MRSIIFAGLLAVVAGSTSADVPTLDQLPEYMARDIQRNPERAIKRFAQQIAEISQNGEIDAESMAVYQAVQIARMRAQRLEHFLAMDLDFDGKLTQDKATKASVGQRNSRLADLHLMMADGDADGDGNLDGAEMRAAVLAEFERQEPRNRRAQRYEDLLALDMNGDGALSIAEMAQSVRMIVGNKCPQACKSD